MPGPVLQAAGNQQTMRALGIRPMMAVSAPTDPEEREADVAADAFVARAPLPMGFGARRSSSEVRRKCSTCEEPMLFRKTDGAAAPGATVHALPPSRGEPLAPALRRPYESFFGADLSAMRVHTGEGADAAARSFGAHAFARGSDVYFRSGRFDPASTEGARLLAHETAHVVQHARNGGDTVHRQPEERGLFGTVVAGVSSFGASVRETGGRLAEAGTELATQALERVAPGALTFFRGVRGFVVEQVRSGFDGMFGGLLRRIRTEGLAGALGSLLGGLGRGAVAGHE